jgi:acyl-coenzyme A synthetase/AMP-(fatty) acid ligase
MGQLFNARGYLLDRRLASGEGQRTALVASTGEVSYARLHDQVCRAVAEMREIGLRPAECVLMVMADSPELIEDCRVGLPSVKRPGAVVFTDVLPTTATGKVRRVELREMGTAVLATPAGRKLPQEEEEEEEVRS